jgi:hypothetical protein
MNMTVTVDLDDDIIYAIAQKQGVKRGYDCLTDPDVDGNLTLMYAAAFEEGMRYIIDLIDKSNEK